MSSRFTIALGTALAGIAFCCFVDSSLAQDALTAPLAASDNDEVDGEGAATRTINLASAVRARLAAR